MGGIQDDFTKLVCRGVCRAAKGLNVDVVVFPGKYINRDLSDNQELMYEYQFNTVFSYATPKNMDAVIVAAGSVGCFATKENLEQMLSQYQGIPCVLISYKLDNYISVTFDNETGIREGLEYLIEKAGCRHFCMIGGSQDNTDAVERKRAFMEVLSQHGIPVSSDRYVEGNFSRKSKETFSRLLSDNPEMEAVFCVNDDTAIGFYDALKERGLLPGKDVNVLGYDDTVMAAKMEPSLSSVRADAGLLGEEALRMAVGLSQGEQVESKVLPTHFVRRDSTGGGQSREEILEEKIQKMKDADAYFDDIFYRYSHEEGREEFRSLLKMLVTVYAQGEDSSENIEKIRKRMDCFFNSRALESADIDNLLNCFEAIYKTLCCMQRSEMERFRLQEMFSAIYRGIIRSTGYRFGRMESQKEQENYAVKLFVRDVLSFEKGNDASYASMLGTLDWLAVKNACIYTFSQPVTHLYKEAFFPPEEFRVKAVLSDGRVSTVPAVSQRIPLGKLFDNEWMQKEGGSAFVCMPLFSNETLYGLWVCDLTEGIFQNGEFLLNHVSSAVKVIQLLQANEKIQRELEESLTVLKENNIALDTLSKSDGLTGILNRRGFYGEAEKLLREKRKENLLVIYVDMNNLKIINDRYGHEEGDFSIKLISRFLTEEIGDKGIVGRIGGDEFACVIECGAEEDSEERIAGIYRRFDAFNSTSDKPYYVTVSAGACTIKGKDSFSLKEALMLADEKLYQVKKYRKKDVVKESPCFKV